MPHRNGRRLKRYASERENSLKTEEKTKSGGDNPLEANLNSVKRRLIRQCTNWEWSNRRTGVFRYSTYSP